MPVGFAGSIQGLLNPIAARKAKIVYNFGLLECNWVKAEALIRLC